MRKEGSVLFARSECFYCCKGKRISTRSSTSIHPVDKASVRSHSKIFGMRWRHDRGILERCKLAILFKYEILVSCFTSSYSSFSPGSLTIPPEIDLFPVESRSMFYFRVNTMQDTVPAVSGI